MDSRTRSRLSAIDWNFYDDPTDCYTHNYHPYPARFIPQIPRELTRIFTTPGDVVYDPFVGCGTTCVEANVNARHAIGCDISGLATLISRVKTTPICEQQITKIRQAVRIAGENQFSAQAHEGDVNYFSDKWFEPHVISELSIIRQHVSSLEIAAIRDFCFVALSAILVRVSKQDSDTRYVRKNKHIKPGDVFRLFRAQTEKMINRMQSSRDCINRGTTTLVTVDSRESLASFAEHADFVVTSPPYPNAYDYHLYHKHRLHMLDINPHSVKAGEIGAHVHYSKRNGLNETDFYKDMECVLTSISSVLKAGRYMAVVIGDSTIHGRRICNSEIVRNASTACGFDYCMKLSRQINSAKKSFNPSHGSIVSENILIFRNGQ